MGSAASSSSKVPVGTRFRRSQDHLTLALVIGLLSREIRKRVLTELVMIVMVEFRSFSEVFRPAVITMFPRVVHLAADTRTCVISGSECSASFRMEQMLIAWEGCSTSYPLG